MRIPDEGDGIPIPEADAPQTICVTDDDFFPTWDVAELRRQFLPAYAQKGEDALRDAVLKAVAAQHNVSHAEGALILAAQQTPSAAWGELLEAWGNEFGRPKLPNEDEGSYRARLVEEVVGVTPPAIKDAVRAALGDLYAPKGAVFVETKRDFVFAASTSWPSTAPRSYVQSRAPGAGRIWASGRRTGLRTAGAYLTSAEGPPEFWVMVPASLSEKRGFAGGGSKTPAAFVGSAGSSILHTAAVSTDHVDAMTATVRAVGERVLGGVEWSIVADPAIALSIVR